MCTVDKQYADNISQHGGWLDGDSDNSMGDNPRCLTIIEYDTAWGGHGYGLVFENEPNRYTESDFVRRPRLYWKLPH